MFSRWISSILAQKLKRPYVHILFGARQTGKSTLLKTLLPQETLEVNLADPRERARHLQSPGLFIEVCEALPRHKTA